MHSPISKFQTDQVVRPKPYTLEITGKHLAQIAAARVEIPASTPINIAFLGNEDHDQRIGAAKTIREYGFEPVPIISSRRLLSQADLDYLVTSFSAAKPLRYLIVGGDPTTPAGPYGDSLAVLQSGILMRHSISQVGVVAYPEGHPRIETDTLWKALKWKLSFLAEAGCSVEITTQFGFDPNAILRWLIQLRDEGIDAPVRIGIPGPTNAGTLLRYAKQFGVSTSNEVLFRFGLSQSDHQKRIIPEWFFDRLLQGIEEHDLESVLYHLYPFGGIADGVSWLNGRLQICDVALP